MTTRTLPRTDIESFVQIAADAIEDLVAVSPTTTTSESMEPAQVSMAASSNAA